MTPALVKLPDDDPRALVSDHEREHAAAIINQAFREGRLDDDSHEARAGRAQSARTRADLYQALDAIPTSTAEDTTVPAPPTPPPPAERGAEEFFEALFDALGPVGGMVVVGFCLVVLIVLPIAALSPGPDQSLDQQGQGVSSTAVMRDGLSDLNHIVRAERKHMASTGHYTRNWTSLGIHDPAIADWPTTEGLSISLTEDRRGAILRWEDTWEDAAGTLRVILDEHGHADRRCLPYEGEHCPRIKGVKR